MLLSLSRLLFSTSIRRPPVVTIMGHVDHGKTTLLDYLRKAHVAASEAGGITQKIGAFSVKLDNDYITFLDTPGHAAFSGIRKRGSRVTDLVVLVVSADDGVMAQTKESIELIKQFNLPVIVAINKVDKFMANVPTVKQQLLRHGIIAEEQGGEVQVVPISALTGSNVEGLLEAIQAQAELLDLQARSEGPVEAVVLETRILPHLGECATLLVQAGTLRSGAILVADEAICRVKRILNAEHAGPSLPAEVIGWRSLPQAGVSVHQCASWEEAVELVAERARLRQQIEVAEGQEQVEHLRQLHERLREAVKAQKEDRHAIKRNVLNYEEVTDSVDTRPCLKLLFRCDAIGTLEAFERLIETIPQGKARLEVVSSEVGPVTESDLRLAQTSKAIVCAFAQEPSKQIMKLASHLRVPLSHHQVIYHLVDHLRGQLAALLPPVWQEEVLGKATIQQVFQLGSQAIAGCQVTEGVIARSPNLAHQQKHVIRLWRNGELVTDQLTIRSMRHEKKEIAQAQKGMECGLQLSGDQFFEGDQIISLLQTPKPDSLD